MRLLLLLFLALALVGCVHQPTDLSEVPHEVLIGGKEDLPPLVREPVIDHDFSTKRDPRDHVIYSPGLTVYHIAPAVNAGVKLYPRQVGSRIVWATDPPPVSYD